MKIRGSIFILIIAGLAIVLILWFHKTKEPETLPVASSETNTVPSVVTTQRQSVQSNGWIGQAVETTNFSKSASSSKADNEVGILSTYNDVPIDFYGIIKDQFGGVVPSAIVDFNVRINNGHESTVKRGEVVSDNNGAFRIVGYRGQDLGFMPKKAGYVLSATGELFKYSHMEEHPYVADPNNPTVIQMWKLQGAAPLASIDQQYKLPFTAEPIYFDLVGRKVVPAGGDLKIIVTRDSGVITQSKPDHRDWSIQLVPVDGGILEPEYNTSHFTFEAPADGYQDSYQVRMNHDSNAWFDNIQRAFFLKSRNGQIYSKFSLNFEINDEPDGTMAFEFKGVANTNGSRNWEQ